MQCVFLSIGQSCCSSLHMLLRSGFMVNRDALPATPRIDCKRMKINRRFAEIIDGEPLKINIDDVMTNRFVDMAAKGIQGRYLNQKEGNHV